MEITKLNKENFEIEALQSDKTVLIDFWAPWCGPCRMLSPTIDEIAKEREDVKVCKINVDEEPELAQRFSVMSIPMLVVIKNGQVTDTSVGMRPKDAILKLL
ncbi:MAG: thioredoxin [Clostridia bacterium]|nr:thioredoxin [Clostridia bacterium]